MEKKIKEAREAIIRLVGEARSMLDGAKDGILNAEGTAKYDKIMADVKEARSSVERMEAQDKMEAELRKSQGVLTAIDAAADKKNEGSDAENRAFRKYLMSGKHSPELRLVAETEEEGGYIVTPQLMLNRLIKKMDDLMFIRRVATVIPVNGSESIGCPTLENDPADADWTAEVGDVSEDTTMSFGGRELKPHLLSKEIKVSMKLLRVSALPVEQLIMDRMAYKFALPMEKTFFTGSGVNQPLGLFTASASGISTDRDYATGNDATELQFDNLIGNKYNVKAQYQANAKWLFSREAVGQLAKMKDGEGRYIWMVSSMVGQPDMLLGSPVMMSEWVPHVFTANLYVGLYGDFSHYWIADGSNFSVQRLNELNARNNKIGFIGRAEVDGMPVLEEAFSRVKLGA